MGEPTNQGGNVGNNGLLQQGKAAHDGFKNEKCSIKDKQEMRKNIMRPRKMIRGLVWHLLGNINEEPLVGKNVGFTFHDVFIFC